MPCLPLGPVQAGRAVSPTPSRSQPTSNWIAMGPRGAPRYAIRSTGARDPAYGSTRIAIRDPRRVNSQTRSRPRGLHPRARPVPHAFQPPCRICMKRTWSLLLMQRLEPTPPFCIVNARYGNLESENA